MTIPERVAPHVRLVFAEMGRTGRTYDEVEIASGVRRAAMKAWRHKNRPSLESLEAVLVSLGWAYTPVPAIEILPPYLAADLAALAAKMKTGIPETWTALVEIAAQQQQTRENATAIFADIENRASQKRTRWLEPPNPTRRLNRSRQTADNNQI